MNRALACGALASVLVPLLLPGVLYAHEVLHTVERGRAVAVKAYFADGESLAYVSYEIYSPADTKIPFQKGRTDRNGYLAFVPDVTGPWRMKIFDSTGHGLDTAVDIASLDAQQAGPASAGKIASSTAFVLRPLIGLLAIGLVFALLTILYRRKDKRP